MKVAKRLLRLLICSFSWARLEDRRGSISRFRGASRLLLTDRQASGAPWWRAPLGPLYRDPPLRLTQPKAPGPKPLGLRTEPPELRTDPPELIRLVRLRLIVEERGGGERWRREVEERGGGERWRRGVEERWRREVEVSNGIRMQVTEEE